MVWGGSIEVDKWGGRGLGQTGGVIEGRQADSAINLASRVCSGLRVHTACLFSSCQQPARYLGRPRNDYTDSTVYVMGCGTRALRGISGPVQARPNYLRIVLHRWQGRAWRGHGREGHNLVPVCPSPCSLHVLACKLACVQYIY